MQESYQNIKEAITWLEKDTAAFFSAYEAQLTAIELRYGIKAGYKPSQPRIPAGQPDGGQWTDDPTHGGNGRHAITVEEVNPYPDAIEEVYPLESALGVLSGRSAISAIGRALNYWRNGRRGSELTSDAETQTIMKSIEEFFGGPPDRTFRNKDGDLIMMKDNKKIRFDIKDPHGTSPHFHLQEKINGKWRNAGDKHQYFFKD